MNDAGRRAAFGELSEFQQEFYRSLRRRADALFELTDSVLCTDGPVTSLVGLSLAAEHRRGHGALYDAVNSGVVEVDRLRRALVGLPLPRDRDGRIVLTVDVSPWLRPDAATAEARSFCHVYGRGRNAAQMIPGWAYSFVAALETGRSSWTAVLDAVRIGPIEDATEVTAGQVREVVNRLREHGRWCDGDPRVLIVFDAGYDVTRLAWLLRDLPVDLVGRLRSDRVLYLPAAASAPGRVGRPARHGEVLDLDQPEDHPDPAVATVTETLRYGTAFADAWDRTHPRLTRRGGWAEHAGPLPIIEGTVIRLCVDRLPGDRNPKPVWLWACATGLSASEVHRIWQAHLRRFDVEHTFRLFKQTLGWTRPRLRDPRAADRWTWLIIALIAHDLANPADQVSEPVRRESCHTFTAQRLTLDQLPHKADLSDPSRCVYSGQSTRVTGTLEPHST
ncbi:NF041680 family putative transposase [Micromonospora sp. WMMA1363]|uniref:NF041680 family putative transposase n=1 Tax=Micromonospora sp. WMMA1363 TaxID=3053985 RepID=UPI00259CCE16|nr:NF041680 family putative transposase [Micromonospora sp. WMMA1363]MDM4723524.1 NF041680 family putative transposase [Micromonospora sp. WMMA1363]